MRSLIEFLLRCYEGMGVSLSLGPRGPFTRMTIIIARTESLSVAGVFWGPELL